MAVEHRLESIITTSRHKGGQLYEVEPPKELHARHLLAVLMLVVLAVSSFNGLRLVLAAGGVFWLLGWVFILCYAYVLFWLGHNVSLAGGHFAWISQLANQQWGRLAGLCIWICCILFIFPTFQSALLFLYAVNGGLIPDINAVLWGGMVCLVMATGLACIPMRYLKHILLLVAALYTGMFIAAGILGIWWVGTGHPPALEHIVWQNRVPHLPNEGAFGMIIWTLLGIETPFLLMDEVKGGVIQQRRACHFIWWGILGLAIAYTLANLGLLLIVPPRFAGEVGSFLLIFTICLGEWVGWVTLSVLVVSQVVIAAVCLLLAARMFIFMARQRLLPQKLLSLDRSGVPRYGIMVQALVTFVFLLFIYGLVPHFVLFPAAPVPGLRIYIITEAITTIIWLLPTAQLFVLVAWSMLKVEKRCQHKESYEGRAMQRGYTRWLLFGVSLVGLLLAVYGVFSTLSHSWIPDLIATPKWMCYVGLWSLIFLIVSWLCIEVPYQGRRLADLKKLITSERQLRQQLQASYHEHEFLALSQQKLLQKRDQLYCEQRLLAITDAVTGLSNHRALMMRLDAAFAYHGKQREHYALFFIDLDHFKHVNDRYGHLVGDLLLHEVGVRLARVVGDGGIVGRYGGEEFVALLWVRDFSHMREVAERLRMQIMKEPFLWRQEREPVPICLRMTVSIGVAVYPLHGTRRQELIALADRAMYRAKSSGRNCVCIVDPGERVQIAKWNGEQKSDAEEMALQALLTMLKVHNEPIYWHGQRLAVLAEAVARRLHCREEDIAHLRVAAMLHDVGKIAVPKEILFKKEPLDRSEWRQMRQHPIIGRAIMAQAGGSFSLVASIIGAHHERWDGTGYPDGLEREEIPLLARILSVVDAYDTMTSVRPYHTPKRVDEACSELVQCMGAQFDPIAVRAFLEVLSQRETEAYLQHVRMSEAVSSKQKQERGGST
ncbi:amino acid permease [Ktedonobacter robiniae]|uniref:Diguanylate cyclase n=1 Tax=Ktedonobacter robiniae TaxID=2778365 RepID=A0ABQ3UQV6_9CHLR|nr:amino acid permease [Ktedonobacter robiniae]GHO54747.1 hypothetical protein KSB_32220 [Ktedonobacter robiniae]